MAGRFIIDKNDIERKMILREKSKRIPVRDKLGILSRRQTKQTTFTSYLPVRDLRYIR